MAKGHKRVRGVPELYDEVKKQVNVTLTPTAVEGLDRIAQSKGLSRSELVEQIGRGCFVIVENEGLFEGDMGGLAAVFSIQALPIERCDELPAVSGAYVVVSRQGVVLGGYARDIYAEFQGNLANIYEFFGDYGEEQQESSAQYLVFWMGCSDELSLRSFRSLLIHSVQRVIIEGQLREFLAKF